MAMNGYVDVDEMMCDGLFDNIEDFLDFSGDDEVLGMESAGNGSGNGDSQMPPAVGAEKISELKSECRVMTTSPLEENGIDENINIGEDWVSNFLNNCNFDIDFPSAAAIAIPTPGNGYINKEEFLFQETTTVIDKDESLFRSSSPISVLEPNNLSDTDKGSISSSSSSSSSCISSTNEITNSASLAPVGPTMSVVPARARSKRPRRAAHITAPILPPSAGGPPAVPTLLPDCESFGESCPPAHPKKKKKRTKMLAAGDSGSESGGSTVGRKCLHCGIQKTPQWRAGPMGPKTLCNACGVRYKSGRLFPEYRPAASPTFVPSIHSNSHKKVVEMRIKANGNKHAPLPQCPAAKNCDLLAYIH